MSNRFNPRYIFTGTGHDYSCVALTGVRQDDFERLEAMFAGMRAKKAEPVAA